MKIELQTVLESMNGMAVSFLARLPHIVLALVVFLIFYFAAKGLRTLVRKVVFRRKGISIHSQFFNRGGDEAA